jgi:hypothetical protein
LPKIKIKIKREIETERKTERERQRKRERNRKIHEKDNMSRLNVHLIKLNQTNTNSLLLHPHSSTFDPHSCAFVCASSHTNSISMVCLLAIEVTNSRC